MSQAQPSGDNQQQLYPSPPPYFHLVSEGILQPPAPIQGTYQLFGEYFTTEDGLPPLQVRKIFDTLPDGSTIDIKQQLLLLHEELLANFMELLRILVEKPSSYARQIENTGLVLRNMQYLANELRPHQARASLIEALKSDIDSKEKSLQTLNEAIQQGKSALHTAQEKLQSQIQHG